MKTLKELAWDATPLRDLRILGDCGKLPDFGDMAVGQCDVCLALGNPDMCKLRAVKATLNFPMRWKEHNASGDYCTLLLCAEHLRSIRDVVFYSNEYYKISASVTSEYEYCRYDLVINETSGCLNFDHQTWFRSQTSKEWFFNHWNNPYVIVPKKPWV